jgi:phage gp29-like protein
MFKKIKKILKPTNHKPRGALVNAQESKRTMLYAQSKAKDILRSLIDLPVPGSWIDDDVIEKIERDSTVTASIGRRKAAVLRKEIIITCKDKTIKDEFEKIFHYELLDSILDTPYQGFSVYEINWELKDYLWYPRLIEREYKDFTLEKEHLFYNANGYAQEIPQYKSIHVTYKAKPKKPYGQPIYAPLFWLIEFKNASMEFWIDLLERFGTPWVIAKTDEDKNVLADEIYNMLGGDGAVLNLEDELDIKTAEKSGNFKEMIEYLDNQIREVITGGNLTGQVTGGSKAAATVHNEIREDIARADENILRNIIKTTVRYFKEVNDYKAELIVDLKDKDEPNVELSERDERIQRMGYRPKKDYIESTYNIKVHDYEPPSPTQDVFQNNMKGQYLSFSSTLPNDTLEVQTKDIDTTTPLTFQEQIVNIVRASTSYEEVSEKLLEAYPDLKTDELEDILFKNIANASILAAAEIEEENPNG